MGCRCACLLAITWDSQWSVGSLLWGGVSRCRGHACPTPPLSGGIPSARAAELAPPSGADAGLECMRRSWQARARPLGVIGNGPQTSVLSAPPPPPAAINTPGSNGPGTPDQWVLAGFLKCLGCPYIDTTEKNNNKKKNKSPGWMQVHNISARSPRMHITIHQSNDSWEPTLRGRCLIFEKVRTVWGESLWRGDHYSKWKKKCYHSKDKKMRRLYGGSEGNVWQYIQTTMVYHHVCRNKRFFCSILPNSL